MRALALILALCATEAAALSCMRPDPIATFNRLSDDPAEYYVLVGQVAFDAGLLPKGVVNAERNPDPIAARFVGRGLTKSGFNATYVADVTLQPVCFGPWCGQATPGVEQLVFAKVTESGVVIEADPCGTTVFAAPDKAGESVTVDAAFVDENLGDLARGSDMSRYVL